MSENEILKLQNKLKTQKIEKENENVTKLEKQKKEKKILEEYSNN